MDASLSSLPLDTIVDRCRQERQRFAQGMAASSLNCIEIFRRAFTGHQPAWTILYHEFEPYMRKIVGKQTVVEVDDVLQFAWLEFARYVPLQTDLLQKTSLGPLIEYLKHTTKTALLQLLRQQKRTLNTSSLDLLLERENQEDAQLTAGSSATGLTEQIELRLMIDQQLSELLHDEDERLIFHLRYELQMKPQEIATHYSDRFPTYERVAVILQRINRRLFKNEILRNLAGPRQKTLHAAFIQVGDEQAANRKDRAVEMRCPYDEEILIDYLTGATTPLVIAAIAASPACVQAAQEVAAQIEPLLKLFYRLHCPTPADLVAYEERQLSATQRLLLYQHLQNCQQCQAELALLTAADEGDTGQGTLLRRIAEAFFRSALALPQPARGDGIYYTPQIAISIITSRSTGTGRTWTLHAQPRTYDNELLTAQVESAVLQAITTQENYSTVPQVGETVLVFRHLPDGEYSLHLIFPNEEIIIRKLEVGEQE